MTPDTLPIVRRSDGFWICPTDAVSDRRGVERFMERLDKGRDPFT